MSAPWGLPSVSLCSVHMVSPAWEFEGSQTFPLVLGFQEKMKEARGRPGPALPVT